MPVRGIFGADRLEPEAAGRGPPMHTWGTDYGLGPPGSGARTSRFRMSIIDHGAGVRGGSSRYAGRLGDWGPT